MLKGRYDAEIEHWTRTEGLICLPDSLSASSNLNGVRSRLVSRAVPLDDASTDIALQGTPRPSTPTPTSASRSILHITSPDKHTLSTYYVHTGTHVSMPRHRVGYNGTDKVGSGDSIPILRFGTSNDMPTVYRLA